MLKNRMLATQQASELEVGNAAYETLFQTPSNAPQPKVCKLPISKLHPFFTADIGFKPYSASKLQALAEHMAAEGQLERIIVRSIPYRDEYEILAGHNRTNAGRLNNWSEIEAEIVDADDERATTIAIATNLLRRQDLTIIERGQAIKMTQLISELQEILEEQPKLLPLACAEKIADYEAVSQRAFIEMCSIEGYQLNIATVNYIVQRCPPPCADRQLIYAAWREARAAEERRAAMPPKKLSFERKKFAPYIEKVGGEDALEKLFLEFLSNHFG